MTVLWGRGEATVVEIQRDLDEALIDSTIRTLLGILERKRCVSRRKRGRAYVYRPTVSRRESSRRQIRQVVDWFFGTPADLMLNLLGSEKLTPEELTKIKAAIRDREARR